MLELSYSNRTEALLALLAERIRAERAAGKGPWEAIHIVAPNPCFKEYLRQGLARELGVAANLHFTYLDGLWQELLVGDRRRLLAFDLLRAGLLAVLGDWAFLGREAMRPVRDYLGDPAAHLKRVQLASELAKVFEEYQMSRPDWIDAWRAGRKATSDPRLETWQSRLWLEVVRVLDGASSADRPVRHLTLLELIGASGFEGSFTGPVLLSKMEPEYSEEARRAIPNTNLMRRFGDVRDIADAVCYLAGPSGDFITGEVLTVDGGTQIWGDQWTIPRPAWFDSQV